MDVHELVSLREAGCAPAWHGEFDHALRLIQQRDFIAAGAAFQHVMESANDDHTTNYYARHFAEIRDHSLPENWSGEVELKEK